MPITAIFEMVCFAIREAKWDFYLKVADKKFTIISLALGIVHFILLWVLIILIKNIVYVAISIGLGIAVVHFYTHFKKKSPPAESNLLNKQLVNYIKKYSAEGYNVQQLRNYLLQKGYSQKDVDQAIKYSNISNLPSNNG